MRAVLCVANSAVEKEKTNDKNTSEARSKAQALTR